MLGITTLKNRREAAKNMDDGLQNMDDGFFEKRWWTMVWWTTVLKSYRLPCVDRFLKDTEDV